MPSDTALGTRRFKALGTSAHLLVTDPGGTDRASALLTEELDAIDSACSRFRPDAELWRVNRAHGRTMRVSSLLAEAVAVALAAADVTDAMWIPPAGARRRGLAMTATSPRLGGTPAHCRSPRYQRRVAGGGA
jgi:FAD:protein FMN transferase